jgi:ribokinase
MNKEGVLVIGSANMDLVVTAQRFPDPGETVFGKKFQMFPGGKGANQAVASAKLGGKTFFIGKFGNDSFYQTLNENMKKDGVLLEHTLVENNESTGVAFIIVNNDGQNEIVVISGSNMKLTPHDIEIKKDLFSQVNVVLCQLEIPVNTVSLAAKMAHQNNTVFILNPAPAADLPAEIFNYIDYLTPNEIELEHISGVKVHDEKTMIEAAKVLLHKGVKNIIITRGSKGALLINEEEVKNYPVNKVEVVDTTAAGDAFNGAIAYSLSKGRSINEAIRFANVVASVSVTRMGAQSSMPILEEIKELVESF